MTTRPSSAIMHMRTDLKLAGSKIKFSLTNFNNMKWAFDTGFISKDKFKSELKNLRLKGITSQCELDIASAIFEIEFILGGWK